MGAFSLNSNLDRAVSVVDPKRTVLEMLLNTTHSITLHYITERQNLMECSGIMRTTSINVEHKGRLSM